MTTEPKPALFLDIDGVLNPVGNPDDLNALTEGWTWRRLVIDGVPWPVLGCAALADWLRSLDARIVWATTWCCTPDNLTKFADHYGLPHADRIDMTAHRDRLDFDGCGKLSAVMEWLNAHPDVERAVWVDDWLTDSDAFVASSRNVTPVLARSDLGLASPALREAIETALTPVEVPR